MPTDTAFSRMVGILLLLISTLTINSVAIDPAIISKIDPAINSKVDPAMDSTVIEPIKVNSSLQANSSDPQIFSRVRFSRCDYILLPRGGFIAKVSETGAGRYLPGHIPVISQADSIGGELKPLPGDNLSRIVSGSQVTVCISPLSLNRYFSGDLLGGLNTIESCIEARAEGNKSMQAEAANDTIIPFNISREWISKQRPGLYAIYALDRNRSLIVLPEPFFLAKGEALLQAEKIVQASETTLGINLSSTEGSNYNKLFAAVIMPRKDYDNAKVRLGDINESNGKRGIILSRGANSVEVNSVEVNSSFISREWIMSMLSLLPENSAVSVQESVQAKVDLYLFTDRPWERGEYVILSAIYSREDGLLGLKQEFIYVV